jgi:hypothetical protein
MGGSKRVLIDRENWARHAPWFLVTIVASVAASVWYFGSFADTGSLPGGSSIPGFTFGVLGGLICAFEMLLWWRKKVRTWRIGRTQAWLRAHIWLGLLSVPLLVYHSGFRFGGPLSTVLMVLFLIVIVSGVWGLALQQFMPRTMLQQVPSETIYSQLDHVAGQLASDGERLIIATCGPAPGEENAAAEEEAIAGAGHLVIGAVRAAGRIQGKILETRVPTSPVPGCEPLRDFFHERAAAYLREGKSADPALGQQDRAAALFRNLRTLLPKHAGDSVDALENLCEQRRQLDVQAGLHFWLHNWLWVHLPLAAALIVLMVVHIFVALKYW